jgi:iron complex outermembrane receptor protein
MYAFGTISGRETEGADIFRHPETNQNVLAVHPDGFLPVTQGENLDAAFNLGLRHDWNGWSVDHAAGIGHNRFEFGVDNSVNASLGPNSPTSFDSGRFRFTQARLNSTADRELGDFGAVRDLHLALGLDYRHEDFSSSAGDPASFAAGDFRFPPELAALVGLPDIGSQAAKGLAPEDEADEDRDVFGGFAELSGRLGAATDFSIAGRWENYSDFGSALAGKVALRHRLGEQLAWRASASNSFRAPSLAQIGWARRDNTFSSDGGRVSSRLVRNDSDIARALGLRELDEETSVNLSTGLSFDSDFGLSAAVDVFRIEIDDRIIQSEFIRDAAVIDFIQTLPGGQGVQALSAFANAVDTETTGVEATLSYRRALAGGQMRLDSAWTWVETEIERIRDNPPELAALSPDATLVGVEQINTIETASPEHRWITTASWQDQRWRALARTRYFSSVVREFSFARQRFGGEWVLDLEAGWKVTPRWEVSVGANNVLDEYPDESADANDFFGNFAFDPINPIGLNGRFVYLNTRLEF